MTLRRGGAVALARTSATSPRTEPVGRTGGGPVGHGRHPGRHRALLDRVRVRARRGARRHLEPRARDATWSATTCSSPGATSASTAASTSSRPRSSRSCSTGVVARIERDGAVAPGRRRAARATCVRSGVPLRAGDDVLPAVRRPGPRARCPTDTFEVVVTGDAVTQGKPHPEPYLKAAAILGVDPRDTRRHRGLQHRRPLRRGGRLHGARRRRTTCRCCRGSGGSSVDTLAGLTPADLPCRGPRPGLTASARSRAAPPRS